MGGSLILFLFLGLIFGIIGGVLFTLLAKHLKGEIRIKIPKRSYKFGETLTGSFTLHAKKEIIGKSLELHLVGYRRKTSYDRDGGKNTRREEIARFSQDIETDVKYEAGLKRDYDITIKIPTKDIIFGNQDEPDFGNSTLGKIAKFALRPGIQKISWQVQVDLDAQGLDIHGKKDIFMSE